MNAVIFDIGGVLLDWDPRYLYRHLFSDPAAMEDFLRRICTPDWHHRHDLGEDIRESCERLARQHPGHADAIMAWAERGEDMVAGQFGETVAVLGTLKAAGVRCYALSNMEPAAFTARRARFPFFGWFDGMVISGLEGVAKPDPRIFRLLLDRHRLDPRTCVFVDDSPRNVEVASSLGMTALRYESPGLLRAGLRGLGLPT